MNSATPNLYTAMQDGNTAAHDLYHNEQDRLEERYQNLPQASWDDIELTIEDDLVELVWEAIGFDVQCDAPGERWPDTQKRLAPEIFEAIATGDCTELGRLLMPKAQRHLIEAAESKIETHMRLDELIDDIQSIGKAA